MMNNELRPYEKYKESKNPFSSMIPEGWKESRFHNLVKLKSICGNSNEELLSVYLNQGVIKYSDTSQKQVHKPSEDMSNYQLVVPGDLVLNNQQAWRGSVGVSRHRGVVSPAYYVFELSKSINSTYANYLFRESAMVSQYVTSSKGVGTIQRNLFYPYLKNAIVILPPRSEQEHIVKYLDHQLTKINKFIKAKKKLIAVLKEQIECYVYGNDVEFSKNINSWEDSFPKEWKMIKASRLTKERNVKHKSEYELLAVTQDRGVVFKKDCEKNYVSPAGDLSGLKLVSNGDYVISLRSFQGGIEFSNIEGIVSPAYNIFSLVNDYDSEEYKHYFKHLFKTKAFISLLNTVVSGIRDGKNINYSDFAKLLLPVPPQNVANKVYKLSLKIDKMQNEFNAEFALLKEFRDVLISDVVTGKVDVRNIAIEELEEEIIEDIELNEDSIDEETLEAEDGDE